MTGLYFRFFFAYPIVARRRVVVNLANQDADARLIEEEFDQIQDPIEEPWDDASTRWALGEEGMDTISGALRPDSGTFNSFPLTFYPNDPILR